MNCVLCKSEMVEELDKIDVAEIEETWLREFDISVKSYFPEDPVTRYVCDTCQLGFFWPPSAGAPEMYASLQAFDWYYEDSKWEFEAATKAIVPGSSVLEVGCGVGRFLEILKAHGFASLTGLESNTEAARRATDKGFFIQSDSEDVAPDSFDAVCAFQVLEHVDDPSSFIQYLCSRLKVGGQLVLAVPNNDGFLGKEDRLPLNMPPHHATRWGRASLRHLEQIAPLKISLIKSEPLSVNHVDWYATTRVDAIPWPRWLRAPAWRILKPMLKHALMLPPLRNLVQGHSIVGVFEKTPESDSHKAS